MSLKLMKEQMKYSGYSLREELINNARTLLNYENENDPSYCGCMFNWIPGEAPHKGEQIHPRIYSRRYSSASGYTLKIQTPYDEKIEVGDLFLNEKDSTFWLCTEMFDMNEISWNGKLTQCNWILKWQKSDGTIMEYPCQDINSTQYNSGESSTLKITLGSSQHMETLPADENTINIESPRRFFLDKNNINPTSFRVTQNDTTAFNYGKGLCKITLTQCESEESDSPEMGICNYIPQLIQESNSSNSNEINSNLGYSLITCNNKPEVYAGGNFKTFVASFYDKSGNELSNINASWTLNTLPEFEESISFTKTKNTIKIKVNDNNNLVNGLIKLMVDDGSGNYSSAITLPIVSMV